MFKYVGRSIEGIAQKGPFTVPQLRAIFNSPTVTPREIREFNAAFKIDLNLLMAGYEELEETDKNENDLPADDENIIDTIMSHSATQATEVDAVVAGTSSKVVSIDTPAQQNISQAPSSPAETNKVVELLQQQLADQVQLIFNYKEIIARSSKIIELLQEQLAKEVRKLQLVGEEKVG